MIDFLLELHRLAIKKTLVGKQKLKKSQTNGAITLISPISTFKTLPNSNFSFGEVESFDAHCFFYQC